MLALQMSPLEVLERSDQSAKLERSNQSAKTDPVLFQGVLESLIDGVLILTHHGEWVHSNYAAHEICQQLNQGQPSIRAVPQPIWRVCQSLIESRDLFPDHPFIIESEIFLSRLSRIRIRARWLELGDVQSPYLLVILEDCYQSLQRQSIAEAQQYNLTPRQTEVWLLRQAGYSYQEMASELWISKDTVKKHLKAIYAKRREVLEWDE
ncbi:helix-turn-helix transcriptional regulator [Stenomitos frigidus]|uniref:Helix-turn-helix transcriptional regulator n=1 Tax=Stenomitos frigidus ULC18 TaxID=2107698 RepID=A0A2T1DSN3_9CYAN|nr:LuxR family transcriptional regulator [Stenomitos frigidus]PSB23492.1 helix-turn-helix transcriptional regulator [Stenomitos frigidus ULC18]